MVHNRMLTCEIRTASQYLLRTNGIFGSTGIYYN